MRTRTSALCLAVGFGIATAARAQQWFAVVSPGAQAAGTHVEADLESVHARGPGGEAVIRVTYDAPRAHGAGFQYRSFVANARFDCQRRTITLTSAAYYAQPAGAGARVGNDGSAKEAGLSSALLDTIPQATRRALLRATCATTQTSAL